MVKADLKKRSITFITQRLEESGLYTILQQTDHSVKVIENPRVRDIPRHIEVVVPNFMGPIIEYTKQCYRNRNQKTYTSPVLYKDGKSAFVRMVDRNRSWRTDKSLKKYSPLQINQMLHLRGIEKNITERFGKKLMYYQPGTDRLEESLREFELNPVELNYSHIDRDHSSYEFVENRESIDYKLPQEVKVIRSAARFLFFPNNPYLQAKIDRCEKA